MIFCKRNDNTDLSKNSMIEKYSYEFEHNTEKDSMNDIIKTFDKQIKYGYHRSEFDIEDENELEVSGYKFDDFEIIAMDYQVSNILIKNGFKKIKHEEFATKIKNLFGRILDQNSNNNYLFVNTINKCDKRFVNYTNDVLMRGFYIIKNNNYISDFYLLPEIVDYKREYPNILDFEKTLSNREQDNNRGIETEITRWKDVEDLDEQRKFNIQLLINRNLYLFNDDKSRLPWLMKNDEIFMKSLVLTFGWEGDDKLLKWVIKETPLKYNSSENNTEEFGKLIYNKGCSGKLKINTRVLELMSEEEIQKHRRDLMDFIHLYLASNMYKDDIELSFPEIAKITAYALDFIIKHPIQEQDIYQYQGLFAEKSDYDNRYDEEFKKNNYYGIPGFKEKWEKAKMEGDGISLPGEE